MPKGRLRHADGWSGNDIGPGTFLPSLLVIQLHHRVQKEAGYTEKVVNKYRVTISTEYFPEYPGIVPRPVQK
jgi:hypothetical protein